jgi:hypothetical protein
MQVRPRALKTGMLHIRKHKSYDMYAAALKSMNGFPNKDI